MPPTRGLRYHLKFYVYAAPVGVRVMRLATKSVAVVLENFDLPTDLPVKAGQNGNNLPQVHFMYTAT